MDIHVPFLGNQEMTEKIEGDMRDITMMENVLLVTLDDVVLRGQQFGELLYKAPQLFNTTYTINICIVDFITGQSMLPSAIKRSLAALRRQNKKKQQPDIPIEDIPYQLLQYKQRGDSFYFLPLDLCAFSYITRWTPCHFAAASTNTVATNFSSFSQGSTIGAGSRGVDHMIKAVNNYRKIINSIKNPRTGKQKFLVTDIKVRRINVVQSGRFAKCVNLTKLDDTYEYQPDLFPAVETGKFCTGTKLTIFADGTYNLIGNVSRRMGTKYIQQAIEDIEQQGAFVEVNRQPNETHAMRKHQNTLKNLSHTSQSYNTINAGTTKQDAARSQKNQQNNDLLKSKLQKNTVRRK